MIIKDFLLFAIRVPTFRLGLILVAIWIIVAVSAPLIAPYSPTKPHPYSVLEPPSAQYLFGTDRNGMDILSRVMWAPRIDLGIALAVTSLSTCIGIPLGAIAGYFGGKGGLFGIISELIMRLIDTFQAFPVFILALALVAVLGPSTINVIIALTFLNTPIFIRLTRSEALSTREKSFIEAARCSGNSESRIIFFHILPNSITTPLAQFSVCLGYAVLATAGLSFVGAGVAIPNAEWGLMISKGATSMITGRWWPAFFPGIALGSCVLGFSFLGNAVKTFIDPKQRREVERV